MSFAQSFSASKAIIQISAIPTPSDNIVTATRASPHRTESQGLRHRPFDWLMIRSRRMRSANLCFRSSIPIPVPIAMWFKQLFFVFKLLVSVGLIALVVGKIDTDAVLARAELRLTRNDLAGAVSELQALDGPSAAAVAPWLRDATARVEAVRALDSLLDTAVARTAGG